MKGTVNAAEEANRESHETGLSRDLREMKDRLRRMETRFVQLAEHMGFDTEKKLPTFAAGQVQLPSMKTSLDDILAALPHSWDGEVAVWHKGVLVTRLRFPPRVSA